jgi:hypothetical protein
MKMLKLNDTSGIFKQNNAN